MDALQKEAYDKKMKECELILEKAGPLPEEFVATGESINEGLHSLTENLDGDRGRIDDAFIIKVDDSCDIHAALKKLIEWKKPFVGFDSSYHWSVYNSTYCHWVFVDEIEKYQKTTMILAESKPQLTEKEIAELKSADITFIYQINKTMYFDWLDRILFEYDYELEPGSVDDAATYAYWTKRIKLKDYPALQYVKKIMSEKNQK